MKTFGIWAWRPTAADLRLAREIGFDRVDIMVNELSKQRTPISFAESLSISADALVGSAKAALDLGFREVHFTAWAMPHVTYMAYAGDNLQHLCGLAGAHGILLDAEEPWTQAGKPDYGSAASTFFAQAKGCRVGVTGIGWCDTDKLGPLMRNADYGCPQVYVVRERRVKVLSHAGIPAVLKHWAQFGKPLHVGLAAYAQAGIEGHTTKSAMRTTLQAVESACDGVSYWSLRQVKGNALVRETLRKMIADSRAAETRVA
ncbi:MAG TPA: hypothetical protein VJP45_10465 [Candidatus Limnocylindria bacterium]|nr:hypothetical protein [Candidatus Limnocylindria bacterium]